MQIHDCTFSCIVCQSQAEGQCIVEALPDSSSVSRSGSTVIILFIVSASKQAPNYSFNSTAGMFILIITAAMISGLSVNIVAVTQII